MLSTQLAFSLYTKLVVDHFSLNIDLCTYRLLYASPLRNRQFARAKPMQKYFRQDSANFYKNILKSSWPCSGPLGVLPGQVQPHTPSFWMICLARTRYFLLQYFFMIRDATKCGACRCTGSNKMLRKTHGRIVSQMQLFQKVTPHQHQHPKLVQHPKLSQQHDNMPGGRPTTNYKPILVLLMSFWDGEEHDANANFTNSKEHLQGLTGLDPSFR